MHEGVGAWKCKWERTLNRSGFNKYIASSIKPKALARELKKWKTMEYEGDSDTNYNFYTRNNL